MILLVSGGLDSFLAYQHLGRPETLFIDYGQPYIDLEQKAVDHLYPHSHKVKITGLPELGNNIHIDGRNMMLATLALRYSNIIYFAAMDDEICSDKNPRAFQTMSRVLTRHSKQKNVEVRSPFWGMTKAEAVTRYLDAGGDPEVLTQTVSCYTDGDEPCLNCQACFRRFVALKSNGIDVPRPSEQIIKSYGLGRLHKVLPRRLGDTIKAIEDDFHRVHMCTELEALEKKEFLNEACLNGDYLIIRSADRKGSINRLDGEVLYHAII